MNSFMSSIKSAATGATTEDKKSNLDEQGLLSSAKLVAEAAQSVATNQTDKVDKTKVAGAGAELLGSLEQYGKFDESQGVGQYIKQGEDYLRQYEKSGATATQAPVDAAEEKVTEAPASVEEKVTEAPADVEEKVTDAPAAVEEKVTEAPADVDEKVIDAPTSVEEKVTEAPADVDEKVTDAPAAVEEKKDEAVVPAEEKKEEAVALSEEKGGKEESGGEFAARDAFKAAGSLFK